MNGKFRRARSAGAALRGFPGQGLAGRMSTTSVLQEKRVCAVGLDVGGTKMVGGVVEFPRGKVLGKRLGLTAPTRGGDAVLNDSLAMASELFEEAERAGMRPLGIGVGVAELVDLEGNITSAQTIAWRGTPVRARFSSLAPTVVEADVRAAALAEATFGAGKPFRIFAYLTVGTGIGYSLVEDTRPFAGARGNALILSSAPLTSTCPRCGAEYDSVLEEFASGPALAARYNKISGRTVEGSEAVFAAAAGGDPAAVQVLTSAGDALGNSAGFLVNVLDPEAIVVGGGVGLAGGIFWNRFVASTRRHIWSDTNRDLPILPAALGNDAGIIGAATAAWKRFGVSEPPG